MAEQLNLWETVGNACLRKAANLLESETTPTVETVNVVRELAEIAIAIDSLNLRWQEQSRYGAAEIRGLTSRPKAKES